MTSYPFEFNSIAIALPCFPEDLFEITFTSSIGSTVGPEVTITFPLALLIQSLISLGSINLPKPLSPMSRFPYEDQLLNDF